MMSNSPNYNEQIAEEAANWCVLLDERELSAEERTAFAEWLKLSPQHVKELLFMHSLGAASENCANSLPDELSQLLEDNVVYPSQIASHESDNTHRYVPKSPPKKLAFLSRASAIWGVAAVLILSVTLGLSSGVFQLQPANDAPLVMVENIKTSVGESRSIRLPDNSKVTLNTDTQLNYVINDEIRRIELVKGEAFFEIASNPKNPLLIKDRHSLILVIGTAFNVSSKENETIISVTEGVVSAQVLNQTLNNPAVWLEADLNITVPHTGTEVRIGKEAVVKQSIDDILVSPASADQIASWLRNEVVFENTLISNVVKEYNRYNTVKVKVLGSELNNQMVSGVFNPKDIDSFIAYLELTHEIKVIREPDMIVVIPS